VSHKAKNNRDRCDHCKKWVDANGHSKSDSGLYTLEGIVSPGLNINFAICNSCFLKQGSESAYWSAWAINHA